MRPMSAATLVNDRDIGRLPSYDVLGVGISVLTPARALATLIKWAKDDVGRIVCIRDVHGVMLARRDPELARIHGIAAMVTPDGMPIALLGKLRGLPVEQTCGPELMPLVMEASASAGLKHYLYGGRDGIAQELARTMRARFPGLAIVGEETPPFRVIDDAELADLAERINASGCDIVWVGLSTPKQEFLMDRLAPLVHCTLIGVGAAYDVHTGQITRPPRWIQHLCLEGAYRLLCEPRRLWRRYLVLAPQFLVLALVQHVKLRLER